MKIFPKNFSEKFSEQTILEIMFFVEKSRIKKTGMSDIVVVVGSSKVTVF